MRVLPVLDLMSGKVVRGVGGRRDEYRPIRSQLVASAVPVEVAAAFASTYDLNEFYLADLDAIAGGEPAWGVYGALAELGYKLWIDAGLADVARAQSLARFCADRATPAQLIIGLESIAGPQSLTEILDVLGRERLVFSLDLKAGQPLTDSANWPDPSTFGIALAAIAAGVKSLIVLDLADVGEDRGLGTLELCRRLRAAQPSLRLIAGGGVRGPGDLRLMAEAGCDAALVASALHDGRLAPADVRAAEKFSVV